MSSTILFSNDNQSVVILQTQYVQFNSFNFKMPNINNNYRQGGFHYGHVMIISGASFLITGMLTNPNPVGFSRTETQPITSQTGRFAAILTGATLLLSGIGVTIVI